MCQYISSSNLVLSMGNNYSGARGVEAPYAVVVWAGAASHEWGTGNSIDAAVLAARAHLLVVTLNYRLGLLGELWLSGLLMCNSQLSCTFVSSNSLVCTF